MTTTSDRTYRRLFTAGAAGAVAAAAVNSLIYATGRAAGVAYVVNTGGKTGHIGLKDVVSLTVFSLAIGMLAAAAATKLRRPSRRTMQVIGAILAVASTWSDLALDGTAPEKITLALMHIVAGITYIASLRIASTVERQTAHPVHARLMEAVTA